MKAPKPREQEARENAHRAVGPHRPQRHQIERDGRRRRARRRHAAAQLEEKGGRGEDRERGLHVEQRAEVRAAEDRPEDERRQHAGEDPGRAERDPVRSARRRQVLAGHLRHRVQHERLPDRHQQLAEQRPGIARVDDASEAAEGGEHGPDGEPAVKGAVEQAARGQGQDHVGQREELGEPADRRLRNPVVVRARRRQRRVGEPEDLRRRGQRRVRRDRPPAATLRLRAHSLTRLTTNRILAPGSVPWVGPITITLAATRRVAND
jgi:hypothetical protein